ncbi:MAG: tryptophan-rich sensory protein [Clostridia bacterium]|nr:tryptophan-rich sensory protein [Clostridia bacterium]
MKRLKNEFYCISGIKAALIVFCAAGAALGVLTWVTSGGAGVFWRIMRKPPLTPPLFVLFIFWILTYLLFGVFAAIVKGAVKKASGALVNAAAGFFLALFWCPLFFSGRFAVASAALFVSGAVLIPAAVRCGRFYTSVFLSAVPLWILEAYFLYLTVGFAVLN